MSEKTSSPRRNLPDREDALLLVRLGHEDGGRVDPDRILRRPPNSHARKCFVMAQHAGWLDGQGWITDAGRAALEEAVDV